MRDVVRPGTVVRWHRAGWRLFWRYKSRPGQSPFCWSFDSLFDEWRATIHCGARRGLGRINVPAIGFADSIGHRRVSGRGPDAVGDQRSDAEEELATLGFEMRSKWREGEDAVAARQGDTGSEQPLEYGADIGWGVGER